MGVMVVSPTGDGRNIVLLSTCSLGLALTQPSPGTAM